MYLQVPTYILSFCCRYIAVHNPIDYNQSMNDAGAIKRRLCKYLLPVLAASILFNLPKFFEAQIEYVADVAGAHNISVRNLFEPYVVL